MTFLIHTFGCKVNSYESESLRERLLDKGFSEAKEGESPDVVFINTCAVTNEAERKDRQKVRTVKRLYPEAKVVVMGCSSQIHPESYLPIADLVLGTTRKGQAEGLLSSDNKCFVQKENRHLAYEDTPIREGEHEERAYVKVQDGCNNFCAYCLVPFARGNSRSRKKDSILEECRVLVASGVKEIVIGGIDTGSYKDPENPAYSLSSLLRDIALLDGEFRIRVSSLETSQIDDELIKVFQDMGKLCPHFHIPLQSGSDKILRLMNRKYGSDHFRDTVSKIRKRLPLAAFSTDVITGFPQETEEDFMSTYSLLKDLCFMRIHAFPYSERPLTRAISLPGKVDVSIRQERTKRLLGLSRENEEIYRKSLLGTRQRLLVEKKVDDRTFAGYTEYYLYCTIESDSDISNTFQDIELS